MKSTSIRTVYARQIMDCNCRPMVEVDIVTEGGVMGRASASTGSSVGSYESYVLRDNNFERFAGLSVFKAVENVNKIIAPALKGVDILNQKEIDAIMIELDGTPQKNKLGGNTIGSVSFAALRTAAKTMNTEVYHYLSEGKLKSLPIPTFNSINGGKYHGFRMAFQEFTFIPYKAENMEEAVEIAFSVFKHIETVIERFQKGEPAKVGHYYGWMPPNDNPETAMEVLHTAVVECGYENKVAYALDCAASEIYDKNTKLYELKGKMVDADEIIALVKRLSEKYNLLYVEDILDENDWDGYKRAVKALNRTIVIGDDFTVTNAERLKKAYQEKAAEGFILKPNQAGTITESLEAVKYANEKGLLVVPSQRAGGAVDDIVPDLAIAINAPAIKNSAPRTGERIYALNCLYRAAEMEPNLDLYDFTPFIRF